VRTTVIEGAHFLDHRHEVREILVVRPQVEHSLARRVDVDRLFDLDAVAPAATDEPRQRPIGERTQRQRDARAAADQAADAAMAQAPDRAGAARGQRQQARLGRPALLQRLREGGLASTLQLRHALG